MSWRPHCCCPGSHRSTACTEAQQMAKQIQLVLGGSGNQDCTDCAAFNGTFLLDYLDSKNGSGMDEDCLSHYQCDLDDTTYPCAFQYYNKVDFWIKYATSATVPGGAGNALFYGTPDPMNAYDPIPVNPGPDPPAGDWSTIQYFGCTTFFGLSFAGLIGLQVYARGNRLACDYLDTERDFSKFLLKSRELRDGFVGPVPRNHWVCTWTDPTLTIKQL